MSTEQLIAKPGETRLQLASRLAKTMQCNCDLDNWQPNINTGHSSVCRIHKLAVQYRLTQLNEPTNEH